MFSFMKKLSRNKIIKKLDWVFSEYIRLRDSDKKGIVTCPLCWKRIFWKYAQNMHFVSRWVLKYRFSEKNCHAGCMRCNVILHWNYIIYTRYMQKKFWYEYVDYIINDKVVFNITTSQLEALIYKYELLRDKLLTEKDLK